MVKLVLIASVVLAAFILDVTGQRFILPTYRPPVNRRPNRPIIRTVRETHNDEPLWLYQGDNIPRAPASGDHPVLPSVIDDVHLDQNRRYARSLDSPSAKRGGGGHSPSGSRDTGATHPGSNRRNARSVEPINEVDPYPIYSRAVRDIQIPGLKKPTHRDIIIPNWNPNVRTQPWQKIGGVRRTRSVDEFDDEVEIQ